MSSVTYLGHNSSGTMAPEECLNRLELDVTVSFSLVCLSQLFVQLIVQNCVYWAIKRRLINLRRTKDLVIWLAFDYWGKTCTHSVTAYRREGTHKYAELRELNITHVFAWTVHSLLLFTVAWRFRSLITVSRTQHLGDGANIYLQHCVPTCYFMLGMCFE